MTATSFERLFRASRIASTGVDRDSFLSLRSMGASRADRDRLVGKIGGGRSSTGGGAPLKALKLSQKLDKRLPMRLHGAKAKLGSFASAPMAYDARQRAVVKVHYFNHAGSGGAALKAHVRYVARDGAARDDLDQTPSTEEAGEREPPEGDARAQARAHADYLSRTDNVHRSAFYDAQSHDVDGAARAEEWARSDLRHFRVILSPENGAAIADLPSYTREVMARSGAALGTKLSWVAVDHHDTDNPHTHVIIRGRRANGQDLVLPTDFIRHGFRNVARDVATEWLGPRSPADERLALDREITRHAPTRLDRIIEAQLPESRTIRIAKLEARNGDIETTRALKGRVRELERMGLARELRRNVLAFEPDWRERLEAMELHLDIRKAMIRTRAQDIARNVDPTRRPRPRPQNGLDR